MRNPILLLIIGVVFQATLATAQNAPKPSDAGKDILIADFEGDRYGDGWSVEGTAFGPGPAKGSFQGQMTVSGFHGKGLVNTFFGGDGSKGKLVSPPFPIERPYISFLIGGGGHAGLAINLLVDGKVVRTATGPNTVPGGSEQLEWNDWEVGEWKGRTATLEIVDDAVDGWGHLNIDQIIQTGRKHASAEKTTTIEPDKDYLLIPITERDPMTWIRVEVDGVWQQEFHCPLTVSGSPDFYATLPVKRWKGRTLRLIAEKVPQNSEGLSMILSSETRGMDKTVYTERYRPQFHFTTRTGWINDPNGLFYYKGLWYLFCQHNPFSTRWGNMTWGYATSPDLFHWTEHDPAIHPDKLGTIFSGSGVVDWNNSAGFQNGNEKTLALLFTYDGGSARFGAKASQGLAYSTDGGKTFIKYDKNPVLPHIIGGNRDPKVIWYEPTKKWIMALYMDKEDYSLFESSDLKQWDKICDINNLGCSECPDFFPLAVDGNAKNVQWVFWGANGKYLIGSFDGRKFTPESKTLTNKFGGNDYAAMTFSDAPDGRRIQISWMNGGRYPGMPFNQQYTVPRELTLRTAPDGSVRLYMEPVRELESLRGKIYETKNLAAGEREDVLIPNENDVFDAEISIDVNNAKKMTLATVGQTIVYSAVEKKIILDGIAAPLEPKDGILKLRIVVDRTSIELFAQDGEVQIAKCRLPQKGVAYTGIVVECEEGTAMIRDAKIWEIKSVWKPK